MGDFPSWVNHLGVPLGTLIVGFLSGFIPVLNIELFLVFVCAIPAQPSVVFLAALATLGQLGAKSVIYSAAAGVSDARFVTKVPRHRVEALKQRLQQHPGSVDVVVLSSAFAGLPPLYIVSLAAGGGWVCAILAFLRGDSWALWSLPPGSPCAEFSARAGALARGALTSDAQAVLPLGATPSPAPLPSPVARGSPAGGRAPRGGIPERRAAHPRRTPAATSPARRRRSARGSPGAGCRSAG